MNGGEPGHGSQIAGTKPRGRFLALELAQASFKSLKVVVTHDLVTGARRLAAPHRHRPQSAMLLVVRALASACMATEVDPVHSRQDAVPCQRAGVLALVRKASQAVP